MRKREREEEKYAVIIPQYINGKQRIAITGVIIVLFILTAGLYHCGEMHKPKDGKGEKPIP